MPENCLLKSHATSKKSFAPPKAANCPPVTNKRINIILKSPNKMTWTG